MDYMSQPTDLFPEPHRAAAERYAARHGLRVVQVSTLPEHDRRRVCRFYGLDEGQAKKAGALRGQRFEWATFR